MRKRGRIIHSGLITFLKIMLTYKRKMIHSVHDMTPNEAHGYPPLKWWRPQPRLLRATSYPAIYHSVLMNFVGSIWAMAFAFTPRLPAVFGNDLPDIPRLPAGNTAVGNRNEIVSRWSSMLRIVCHFEWFNFWSIFSHRKKTPRLGRHVRPLPDEISRKWSCRRPCSNGMDPGYTKWWTTGSSIGAMRSLAGTLGRDWNETHQLGYGSIWINVI